MRTLAGAVAAALVLTSASAVPPSFGQLPDGRIELEEVASGVFAALQPREQRFDDANTLIVPCATTGALLVDPPSTPDRLEALVSELRRRGWTVSVIVSTHWHGDHTQGNAAIVDAFGGAVDIVGHETLSDDVPGRAAAAHAERVALYEREIPAARDRLERRVRRDGTPLESDDVPAAREAITRAEAWLEANRDARFLAPTTTFGERKTLELCGRTVDLVHFRAHTRGDTVVRLPAEGVVATGDLLDDLPYVGHGHPRSWLEALDAIDAWDAELFVPGHGPLFRDEGKLDAVRGYLRDLVELSERARASGASSEEAQSKLDLSRWRSELAGDDPTARRFFDQTVAEAIERAFEEAAGSEPPPRR